MSERLPVPWMVAVVVVIAAAELAAPPRPRHSLDVAVALHEAFSGPQAGILSKEVQ
jgi:hypothetical protein